MLNRVQNTRDVRRKLVTAWDPSILARKKARASAEYTRRYDRDCEQVIQFACQVTRARMRMTKIGDVYSDVKELVAQINSAGLTTVGSGYVTDVLRREVEFTNGQHTPERHCKIYREKEGIKYEYHRKSWLQSTATA